MDIDKLFKVMRGTIAPALYLFGIPGPKIAFR